MEKIRPEELQLNFSSTLFFDTNIWLYLFSTIANSQRERQQQYSSLFEEALRKKSPIYISSMVVSEFANVILRREFNTWKRENGKHTADYKKDFVGTAVYKEKTELVKNKLNKILSLPNIIKSPDAFNNLNQASIFTNFGLADFNDAYINELVSTNNWILVTDDGDFEEIFSGNKLVTLS